MTRDEALDQAIELERMFEKRWYDTFTPREQIIVDRIHALRKYWMEETDTIDGNWVLPPAEKQ